MKPILDVACGPKHFYHDKNDTRVLFCDNRKCSINLRGGGRIDVSPDVQCDFTALPFDDNTFYQVVFDPPHLVHSRGRNSRMVDTYGSLHKTLNPVFKTELFVSWRDVLRAGFSECFRVLKPNGTLIFKWNDTDIKVSEILELTPEKPVFGNKSGKASKTHWICFFKEG